MLQNIAVLGSTGSIGTQTLDVIRRYPDRFKASMLIAGRNAELLAAQCLEFRPKVAIIADESKYSLLRQSLSGTGIEIKAGADAVADAMESDIFETVVTATVGYSGLLPTIRAIRAGKRIALANKETLVVAGNLINSLLEKSRSTLVPVDSEHSAIYQCLRGEESRSVEKLIITASGGPFRRLSADKLRDVTCADALKHPRWHMGNKITIDSATMMNKAFEIIEARWLFGVTPDKITAVVHPQAIVHSMVQFTDGAVKAQLGLPDMRLPICYALSDGERLPAPAPHLELADYAHLTFFKPSEKKFPCLKFAHLALQRGGNTACIINAANEVAVNAFLNNQIRFTDFYPIISEVIEKVQFIAEPTLDDFMETDTLSRHMTRQLIK